MAEVIPAKIDRKYGTRSSEQLLAPKTMWYKMLSYRRETALQGAL